jgi:predicted amino acid-binding ACT domain protein
MSSRERIFITAIGNNDIGVVASLTATLLTYNIDIADVTQKILDDKFVLFMIVEAKQGTDLEELQKHLENATRKFRMKIMLAHENLFNAMHRI